MSRIRSDGDAGGLEAQAMVATYRKWDRPARVAEAHGVGRAARSRVRRWVAGGIFRSGARAGAHAPSEYWLVESANPKVAGMDGSARSFVDLFYALA
jgi:hypothetical protein